MRVFIDTNSLLSYFAEDAEVSSLEELERLLSDKKLVLFYTEQVKNEYARNVANRIDQVRKAINKLALQLSYSGSIEEEALKKSIQSKIDQANELFEAHRKKRLGNYEANAQKTDDLVARIFGLAECVPHTNELVERAKLRHIKGNPPKKNNDNSHGDAINWESILEKAIDDDLTIITRDPDFTERGHKGDVLNRLLREEWALKTKKTLDHFLALGAFINSFEKKGVISKKAIKRETVVPASVLDYQGLIVKDALRTLELADSARTSAILSLSSLPTMEPFTNGVVLAQNAFQTMQFGAGLAFSDALKIPSVNLAHEAIGDTPLSTMTFQPAPQNGLVTPPEKPKESK